MTTAKPARLLIAISFIALSLFFLQPHLAWAGQVSTPSQARFNPTLESVSNTLAFISWTAPNPGGTILHYAVVRYGKDPNHLDFLAQSPTRINLSHNDMVFRVRVQNLEPGTTYYFKVFSEQANGAADPGTSGVNQFTTDSTNRISAKK
jgi:hypothetical protein